MHFNVQPRQFCGRMSGGFVLLLLVTGLFCGRQVSRAADVKGAREALASGRYDQCIGLAQAALQAKEDEEAWGVLLTEALLTRGRYLQALSVATNALAAEPRSLCLHWSVRQALLANGQTVAADEMIAKTYQLFTSRYWQYRTARDLVVFGRAALAAGMEPKTVLDKIYAAAKQADPKCPDPYLASGQLALEKHDFALAARYFQEGIKQLPQHPDLHVGLAKAYAPSEQRLMLEALTTALEYNTNHVESLLLLADHHIDAEDYRQAAALLARVDTVNPAHPEAWAYRAVLAHLQHQPDAEAKARARALTSWGTNPRVDHLIGRKLSQKYRFAEGAACQRRALAFAPDYLPAKSQLAQDLLRLGEEGEGWLLAQAVQRADGYDVAANNLVTLQEVLTRFQTLTNEHFVLRMHPREASLYGRRALALLERARTRLCSRYGIEFTKPVLVELFPEEKDFAVRTFGMPENGSYLGVCFGQVITANSPGARGGRPFNWESMLWHEFCHVVTLQLTQNKMPRWLSEGISVYEERQANSAWGEQLNPRYREMMLGEDLTPVSKLSGAFLAPKSPLHLQFAYYQSSLVVQFLSERFGSDKLKAILRELGQGREVNEALVRHTVPMRQLDQEFAAYARKVADGLAPGVDWEKPKELAGMARVRRSGGSNENSEGAPRISASAWEAWAKARPTNYWVLLRQAERLADEKNWPEAKPFFQQLVQLYPNATGADSPLRRLAQVHRELGETNAERQVLTRLAERDDQAPDAYLRLMELASERADWPTVLTNAQRYLAVNPLVPGPYRFLAQASEATGDGAAAIEAYRVLLQLDPPHPAEVHFRLASLLHRQRDPQARRHVLQALEEAPRFREALLLLRQMRQEAPSAASQTSSTLYKQ